MCGVWGRVKKFVVTAVVIIAVWIVAVFSLNQTVFSPGGYVLAYLDALERGEFGEASARAGLTELPAVLPHPESLVTDATVAATLIVDSDEVVIRVTYLLDGVASESLFSVTRLPRILGLFDRWEFREAPLGSLSATVLGAKEVVINGVTLPESLTEAGVDVLYPGSYQVSWSSGWLETETVDVAIEGPQTQSVSLVALPTAELRQRVNEAVNTYLTVCINQAVLQPTGCPFGVTITDRVAGDVVWEITSEPRIILALGTDEKTWEVSTEGGDVTLTVSVQSLFDGELSDYVETQQVDITGVLQGLDANRPRFIVD